MRIAILEDEATLADELKTFLSQSGNEVKVFSDGEALVRVLRRGMFDLYVLDWHVPKINGLEVLKHMRHTLSMTEPVIFLTSANAENEIVEALTNGADDYCIKPIRLREFLARLHSIERRSNRPIPSPTEAKEILGYTFNPVDHVISFEDQRVVLTDKEFSLALLLFSEVDRPIARNRILLEVWGVAGDELSRTLDVHVAWIRKKLNIGANSNVLRLSSVYGYGYRLMQVFSED